ncbi:type VI secretion system lipoprotein TssJ [Roseateles sp. BYS180W]|uniref:Type VI secretion system lipoprotein TssJ n=1 Tax=Roseateles rivi TaxID=3299028 RepID=A0ABW7FRZ4_9BURK
MRPNRSQSTPSKPGSSGRFKGLLSLSFAAACTLMTAGCSSGSGGVLSKSLEAVGLKAPDNINPTTISAAMPKMERKVTLRIHAGEQLNTDPQKRSLAVVVRVYKLRGVNAFLNAPYSSFASPKNEREAFGNDLVDVRELVLTPGQKHEVIETLPVSTSHIAVVSLFRAPAQGRWRFAFKAAESESSGITVGLHGCAMNVAAGVTEGADPDTLRLAGVNCH